MTGTLGAVAAAAVGVAQVARELLLHRNLELEGIAGLPLPDNDAPLEIPVRRGVGVGLGAELHHGRRARPAQNHAVVEIADRPFDKGVVQRQGGIDTERLVDREIVPGRRRRSCRAPCDSRTEAVEDSDSVITLT